MKSQASLSPWDLFVLRHHKPGNLAVHAVSAALFFGAPIQGVVQGGWAWFAVFCLSGCIGTASHYMFRDGRVNIHEATSSPRVVGYNIKMWWRIVTLRYGVDIHRAKALLAREQTSLGRTVVVTGAGSGFGRAAALELLARGWSVIASIRRDGDAEALGAPHPRLTILRGDLADAADRAALIEHVLARPRLDGLVNAAGMGVFGALEALREEDLRSEMEINFFAGALLAQAFVPKLRRHRGALIQLSSPAGVAAFPWTSAYCASKGAIEALMESLHHEAGHSVFDEGTREASPPLDRLGRQLRVHLVTPSAHRTAFFARSRWVFGPTRDHDRHVLGYRAAMDRTQRRELPPAARVGEVIAELVERSGGGLRIDVGMPVRVLRAMRALTPAALFDFVMNKVFADAAGPGRLTAKQVRLPTRLRELAARCAGLRPLLPGRLTAKQVRLPTRLRELAARCAGLRPLLPGRLTAKQVRLPTRLRELAARCAGLRPLLPGRLTAKQVRLPTRLRELAARCAGLRPLRPKEPSGAEAKAVAAISHSPAPRSSADGAP